MRVRSTGSAAVRVIGTMALLFILLSAGVSSSQAALPPEQQSRVLILNSYHPFYTWSDHELEGILQTMRKVIPRFEPLIEYLDCKFFADQDHFKELRNLYRHKFRNTTIPVVIATDNPALQFAMTHRQELFPHAPIVFCGINGFSQEMIAGQRNITGVAEILDARGTVEIMLQLHPTTREIFVIHDYTTTGLATRREAQVQLAPLEGRVKIRYMPDLTTDQMLEELKTLPANALVLALSYSRDREGRVFDHTQIARLLSENSPVAVYGTHEDRLGFGIVGGSLLSAKLHGARAAEIALEVLGGRDASTIPVETRSTARPAFDYLQLERFGINLDSLPPVSLLVNKPESFYEKYPMLVWAFVSILGGLVAVILVLVYTSAVRKRAAFALEEKAEELEQRVHERTLQLETANHELEAFCYSVSHDLRAPLRHVNGFSRIVMEDYGPALDSEGRRYLERICGACDRMGQLIDDLLELSRVSRSEMRHDSVSLTEVAREVIADLQRSQPDRSVTVTLAETVPVTGDVRLLRLVMENLLGNAWKYTGNTGAAEIAFGEQSVDGDRVFFVRDNGAGFDMAYADKLFNPFQRLHGAEFEGSGIGLATVQRIILRHGGTVWADAAVGEGATFRFTLGTDPWSAPDQ